MITTNPIRVLPAMITASSVPYPDTGETVWSSATSYALNQTISYSINGIPHKFQSKQASNLNHTPSAYPDDANNPWWLDLGYANRYTAFQLERNTQTIAPSPYSVSINPGGRVGCIGIGNVTADSVTLNVKDSLGVIVKTETKQLQGREVYDWYTWTFSTFDQLKNTLFINLPLNSAYTFELVFTRSSGNVGVGAIVPGMPVDIGRALMGGAGIRFLNFSTFERDEFGESKITIRRNIPRTTYQLRIDKARLSGVIRLLDQLNGVVTMWAGVTDSGHGYFENTFIIGMYKDFGNTIDQPNYVQADIEIEAI